MECPLCMNPIRPGEPTARSGDTVMHLKCYEKEMSGGKKTN